MSDDDIICPHAASEAKRLLERSITDFKADLTFRSGKGAGADLPPTTMPFRVITYLAGEVVDSHACIGSDIGRTVHVLANHKTWDRIEVVSLPATDASNAALKDAFEEGFWAGMAKADELEGKNRSVEGVPGLDGAWEQYLSGLAK